LEGRKNAELEGREENNGSKRCDHEARMGGYFVEKGRWREAKAVVCGVLTPTMLMHRMTTWRGTDEKRKVKWHTRAREGRRERAYGGGNKGEPRFHKRCNIKIT